MATEGVLLHDGAQCVAAADYSNTAGLLGQGGSAQFYAVYVSAARTVAIATATTARIYGILQNKPKLGEAADVGVLGPSKMYANGTIAAGALLMSDSGGRIVTWASGAGNPQLGIALEAAVAGQVFTGYVFGPGGPLVLT
jgi:hypothetical protein